MKPIKPRNERGNKLVRYLLAALLLIGIIGGGAYGVTRLLSNDDDKSGGIAFLPSTDASPTTSPVTDLAEETESEPTPTTAPQPTATAAPTESTDDQVEENTTAEDPPATTAPDIEISSSSGSSDITTEEFLPEASVLGPDWEITGEGGRTKGQVADAIGSNGEELLTQWRWRENLYRDLTRIDPDSYPDEATNVSVSIHRFANEQGAADALTVLADVVVEAQGLQDVETPAVGDLARGLSGPGNGVNLYVLYVQDGKYLIRLGGASATGDSAGLINDLAETIVAAHSSTN